MPLTGVISYVFCIYICIVYTWSPLQSRR